MLLKRHYRFPEGWKPDVNTKDAAGKLKDPSRPEGATLNTPPVDYVTVKHTGVGAEQNFSERAVMAAVSDGWMTLGKGKLTIHGKPEDLVYAIRRAPGHYCCHCKARLIDAAAFVEPGVTAGMKHVATVHAGAKSPDPSNLSGYERINYYDCVLGPEQHRKFQFRKPQQRRSANG